MAHEQSYFPKQLFSRFLFNQLFVTILLLLLSAGGTRLYLTERLKNLASVDEALRFFDQAFLFLALVMLAVFIGVSLWMGYRLVLPLGRIIVKARAIVRKEYSRNDEAASTETVEGEWSDLERTLNRIERNMLSQDLSLSKERGETEALISAITEAVIAVDKEGNLLFFNSQFAVLFGEEEVRKGKSRLSDFFRDPDVLDTVKDTLQDGQARGVSTQITLKGESAPRYFSLSAAPLKVQGGDTYGAVCVFHDVSDLKRLDQVRIDFVANVSHELRTPLTAIKGYAQTLKADAQGPMAKYLDTIERNTDRLIALVNDLLNLSSIESGELDLRKSNLSVKELTDKVLQQLESLRLEKNQNIKTVYEAESVFADPKRIEQVLFNLIENALKYVPKEKEVTVRWQERNQEVLLSVKDNGPGIAPEHHPRLFERFYRVESSRNREQGGTGLGLAIVKHIVQRHGGKIRVQGALGRGTEFVCSFPKEKY